MYIGGIPFKNCDVPTSLTAQYCNLTGDNASQTYELTTYSPDSNFTMFPRYEIGYMNASWKTDRYRFGLPTNISDPSSTLIVNFSYNPTMIVSSSWVSIIVIEIRDDFDEQTGTFNMIRLNPVALVKIYPQTKSVTILGTYGGVVNIQGKSYTKYVATESRNGESIEVAKYPLVTEQSSYHGVDLMMVVRDYVTNTNTSFRSKLKHISAVTMGFYVWGGKFKFIISNLFVDGSTTRNPTTNQTATPIGTQPVSASQSAQMLQAFRESNISKHV